MLPNINWQIGSPNARKVDKRIDEKSKLDLIEKFIFDFITLVSFNLFLSMLLDCSLIEGIIVTAKEPINVEGIIKIGNVIPIMMPNSESASV